MFGPVLGRGRRTPAAVDGDDPVLWDTGCDPVPRTPRARLACSAENGTELNMTFGGPDAYMLADLCGGEPATPVLFRWNHPFSVLDG